MTLQHKSVDLVLPGDTPSKKNSKRIFMRGKFPVILPGKKHEQWHNDLSRSITLPQLNIELTELITITFYFETKRKCDISNKAESVMDYLVDAGVLSDDNFSVVPNLNISFGGYDKENPRAEITIYY